MTIKSTFALISFMILLTSCGKSQLESEYRVCVPSFRPISDAPIEAAYGSWKILFAVALVGCRDHLDSLTSGELILIQNEFREPAEWSNLLLYSDAYKDQFRAVAASRSNALLERQIVTDVIIYNLTIIDHSNYK